MPDRDDDHHSRPNNHNQDPNPIAPVSSLLSAIFPPPDPLDAEFLASSSASIRARLLCFSGEADKRKCDKLAELDRRDMELQFQRESLLWRGEYARGEEVGARGEEVVQEMRRVERRICDEEEERKEVERRGTGERREGVSSEGDKEIVERVANRKAQEWAWDWDWGFPRPFDARDEQAGPRRREMGHGFWGRRRCGRDESSSADWEDVKRSAHEDDAERRPRVWHWSFQWPPAPADSERGRRAHGSLRTQGAWEDAYSPYSLENNERLQQADIPWRDAYEDLLRTQRGLDVMPERDLFKSKEMPYWDWVRRLAKPTTPERWPSQGQYPKRVPWTDEEENEQPSYEYGHDHEDQHDEPPSPTSEKPQNASGAPATELDAYERLLSSSHSYFDGPRPSVMSTLTTTQRTVAPDGTVTTKVVLKKRFADGREENSETVHTQRPQDIDAQGTDGEPQSQTNSQNNAKPRSGWFWSK